MVSAHRKRKILARRGDIEEIPEEEIIIIDDKFETKEEIDKEIKRLKEAKKNASN